MNRGSYGGGRSGVSGSSAGSRSFGGASVGGGRSDGGSGATGGRSGTGTGSGGAGVVPVADLVGPVAKAWRNKTRSPNFGASVVYSQKPVFSIPSIITGGGVRI